MVLNRIEIIFLLYFLFSSFYERMIFISVFLMQAKTFINPVLRVPPSYEMGLMTFPIQISHHVCSITFRFAEEYFEDLYAFIHFNLPMHLSYTFFWPVLWILNKFHYFFSVYRQLTEACRKAIQKRN